MPISPLGCVVQYCMPHRIAREPAAGETPEQYDAYVRSETALNDQYNKLATVGAAVGGALTGIAGIYQLIDKCPQIHGTTTRAGDIITSPMNAQLGCGFGVVALAGGCLGAVAAFYAAKLSFPDYKPPERPQSRGGNDGAAGPVSTLV